MDSLPSRKGRYCIADDLRAAILRGEHRSGDRLPPTRVLGDRYATSHANVSAALAILEREGLVRKRQGSGVYVLPWSLRTDADRGLGVYTEYAYLPEVENGLGRFQEANRDIPLSHGVSVHASDVMIMGTSRVVDAMRSGALRSMDDLMSESRLEGGDFHRAGLAAGISDDRVYAFPLFFSPFVLFANCALAGRELLKSFPDWGLDDLSNAIEKMSGRAESGDWAPYRFSYSFLSQVYPFLISFGGKIYEPETGRCPLTEPESIEAFRYSVRLCDLLPVRPNPRGGTWSEFLKGGFALFPGVGASFPLIPPDFQGNVAVAPMPQGPFSRFPLYGNWIAISGKCRNPHVAWRLVRHMTGLREQNRMAEQQYLFPGRRQSIEKLRKMYPGRYDRCIDRIEQMEPVIPPVSRHGLLFLDKLLKGWQDAVNLPSFVEKTAGVFESWMQGGDDTDRDGLHVVGL